MVGQPGGDASPAHPVKENESDDLSEQPGPSALPRVRGKRWTMTLHIDAVRGQSTWWVWVIRDTAGVLIEESTIQFRSAAAAEVSGRARLAVFEEERRQQSASR